jgi:lipid-binding SYLF domain-containing protein
MKRRLAGLLALVLLASLPIAFAQEEKAKEKDAKDAKEATEKKAKIDQMAKETLAKLMKESAAKALYEKAYGYAVFDNKKVAFLVSGGGGSGVAVQKGTGGRTYMKMGTGGVGVGLGYKQYQVVMLFENKETFTNFIEKGWKAESGASAAAGTAGAGVGTTFTNGIAVYQFTDKGLIAQADITGTKYWKDEDLNK